MFSLASYSLGNQHGFHLKTNYYAKNLEEGLSLTSMGKGMAFLYSGMNDGTLEYKYNIKIVDVDLINEDQNVIAVINQQNQNALVTELYEVIRDTPTLK